MIKIKILHGHIFCGIGGGAEGFDQAEARVGNLVGKFECVGGIDVDAAACRDFSRRIGVATTCRDLFTREQYMAFHGREPPRGWSEAVPDDLRRAAPEHHLPVGAVQGLLRAPLGDGVALGEVPGAQRGGTGRAMSPNYEPLFYWIKEREFIRLRKAHGDRPPWTADTILATYRFCNLRREDDRVTIWIRENIRERFAGHPLLWLMLSMARQIDWPDTLAELIVADAWPDNPQFRGARQRIRASANFFPMESFTVARTS